MRIFISFPKSIFTADEMGSLDGYTLLADGRFYKYFGDLKNLQDSRLACLNEGATLAVPHPNYLYEILKTVPSYSYSVYVGITSLDPVGSGKFWTDDGMFMDSSTNIVIHAIKPP